jgi:hypothetical protein
MMERRWSFTSGLLLLLLALYAGCSLSSMPCSEDAECAELYNEAYSCEAQRCLRRHYSYTTRELVGFAVVVLISTITNAGGVGAGTVVVPAYIVFFGFVSSDAVHLSRITIFAGAFVNFLLNWRKRDPKEKDRLLIDYKMGSVMIPLHLAGAEVGVMVGKFLPAVLVTGVLFCFLLLSILKTYQRGRAEIKKEAASSSNNSPTGSASFRFGAVSRPDCSHTPR